MWLISTYFIYKSQNFTLNVSPYFRWNSDVKNQSNTSMKVWHLSECHEKVVALRGFIPIALSRRFVFQVSRNVAIILSVYFERLLKLDWARYNNILYQSCNNGGISLFVWTESFRYLQALLNYISSDVTSHHDWYIFICRCNFIFI